MINYARFIGPVFGLLALAFQWGVAEAESEQAAHLVYRELSSEEAAIVETYVATCAKYLEQVEWSTQFTQLRLSTRPQINLPAELGPGVSRVFGDADKEAEVGDASQGAVWRGSAEFSGLKFVVDRTMSRRVGGEEKSLTKIVCFDGERFEELVSTDAVDAQPLRTAQPKESKAHEADPRRKWFPGLAPWTSLKPSDRDSIEETFVVLGDSDEASSFTIVTRHDALRGRLFRRFAFDRASGHLLKYIIQFGQGGDGQRITLQYGTGDIPSAVTVDQGRLRGFDDEDDWMLRDSWELHDFHVRGTGEKIPDRTFSLPPLPPRGTVARRIAPPLAPPQ